MEETVYGIHGALKALEAKYYRSGVLGLALGERSEAVFLGDVIISPNKVRGWDVAVVKPGEPREERGNFDAEGAVALALATWNIEKVKSYFADNP
jgi:hypothetical protein